MEGGGYEYGIYNEVVDPQFRDLVKEGISGDFFNVQFSVHVQYVPTRPQLPAVTPFHPFYSSLIIPCNQLLDDAPTFLRDHLPHIVTDALISTLTPDIVSYAKERLVKRDNDANKLRARVLAFGVCIDLDVPYDESDEDIMEWITQHVSMQEGEVRMVPATEEAIASLGDVKLERGAEASCSICLEGFDGDDVSACSMPCKHVFHRECIVQWLETSHMCPLCRYQMPVAME